MNKLNKQIKRLKQQLKQQGSKAKLLAHAINEGTKLRFTCSDMDIKIMAKLEEKPKWKTYPPEKQEQIRDIIREECFQQEQYKAKELAGLARRIEKRLKKEIPKHEKK